MENMESILITIKQMLGPGAEHEHFDPEIINHINSVLADLNQMGVGPDDGLRIEDETSVWSDFIDTDTNLFDTVKTYIYLRVKLVFDPPTSSAVLNAYQRDIEKWEFRLNVAAES